MKKLFSILLIGALLASCALIPVQAFVWDDSNLELPFELIPARTVSMDKVEGEETSIQFSYSMEADMIKLMQDFEDSDEKEQILNNLGIDDMWISAQIDWALDDPTDWHHNDAWDDNKDTRYWGLGHIADGRLGVCDWDIMEVLLYANATNDCWITRYCGNPLDPEDTAWNGTEYEGGYRSPGMKDVLKEGQYTIKEGDPGDGYISIDYSEHTMYARMRYYVTIRHADSDENDCIDTFLFSDWSETAAYGKDAPQWIPPNETTLEAPDISNLFETGEEFNDYPIVGYDLALSDKLNKDVTEVTSHGGGISIETEARVKGTKNWIRLQGDWEPKSGKMYSDILAINGYFADGCGKPVPKGTEIEFRARYFCSVSLSKTGETIDEFYSPYSSILSVTFENDYAPEQHSHTATSEPEPEPKIKDLDDGATTTQVDTFITGLKNDNDPKGTTFGLLSAKQKKVATNYITISWNKVKGAKNYVIYGNKCGKGVPYKYITTTTKTTYTQKKLKKGTYYKYLVIAFDKNGKSIATAKTLHITTKGGKKCNFGKLTTAAKKDKVTLQKKGKTFNLKAKATPEEKKKTVSVHRKIQYESSNTKIATVSSKGVITAKKKGVCYVYAYAQSGAYKKIKVTVSK